MSLALLCEHIPTQVPPVRTAYVSLMTLDAAVEGCSSSLMTLSEHTNTHMLNEHYCIFRFGIGLSGGLEGGLGGKAHAARMTLLLERMSRHMINQPALGAVRVRCGARVCLSVARPLTQHNAADNEHGRHDGGTQWWR